MSGSERFPDAGRQVGLLIDRQVLTHRAMLGRKLAGFIMSRMIPSIFRISAGSMKVSSRICALFSFSLSSIFEFSSTFEPEKSTTLTRCRSSML